MLKEGRKDVKKVSDSVTMPSQFRCPVDISTETAFVLKPEG